MSEINYRIILEFLEVADTQDLSSEARRRLINEGISFYAHRCGEERISREAEHAVESAIESLFHERRSESFRWTCPTSNIRAGDTVSCTIKGQQIKATVSVSPKNIQVDIMEPVKESYSSCIFTLAPEIYTTEPFEGFPANGKGVDAIMRLLVEFHYSQEKSSGM